MLHSFDIDKTRAHRLAEARAGFPLLRGCPNTTAISLCGFLDRIGQDQWSDFAGQMSDFVQTDHPTSGMAVDERRKKLAEFPLVDALLGPAFGPSPQPAKRDFAQIPVKIVAGLMNDDSVGGLQGWARMIGAPDMAFIPAKDHAATLEELGPVAPKRLRKLIDDALVGGFGLSARKVSSDCAATKPRTKTGG